tara:strand:+ start:1040 stop:1420 length:381 start_codon:yes stop_codon:yes gene_type:complete
MLLALLNVPADYALSPWPVLSGTAPSTPCCPDGFREIKSFEECRYVYDSLKTVEPMGIFSTTCSGNMAGLRNCLVRVSDTHRERDIFWCGPEPAPCLYPSCPFEDITNYVVYRLCYAANGSSPASS